MKDMACQTENTRRLGVALGITLLFFSLELIGGILTNSLALLTDAWHMLNDVIGLAFSIGASFVALKPATIKKTYGYYRIEIIAGFLNGIFLWAIVAFIILEAVQRIQQPQHVDSLSVFIIALLGLAANGLSAIVLSKSSRSSLNVKGAFLHVLSDLLGSLGVILAAVIMLLTGWYQADAVVSIFVGVLVFYGSGRLVFESLNILLEGVPGDVDISSLDEGHRNYSLHELLIAAEAASAMEVRHFVIHPGPDKTLNFSVEERMQRLRNAADVLNKVAKRCRELNVGLVLENMLPHLPFGSTSDMLWIIGAMESLNICTCLDTGHATLSGDLYKVLYKLSGHLRVIHANDNMGTADDHLPPGKGTVDWGKVLFELSETNFHGGMILELAGTGSKDIKGTLDAARKARLFIRNISRSLYLSSPPSVDVATRLGKDGIPEH